MRYLVHFNASAAAEICLAEFDALIDREGLSREAVYSVADAAAQHPYVLATFASDDEARRVMHTAVQIRHYYTLWTSSPWFSSLHEAVAEVACAPLALTAPATASDVSWRLFVAAENGRLPHGCSTASIRDHLADAVAFRGKVDLSDSAQVTLTVLLDFGPHAAALAAQRGAVAHTGRGGGCAPSCEASRSSADLAAPLPAASPSLPLRFSPALCEGAKLCGAPDDAPAPAPAPQPYRVAVGVRHECSRRLVGSLCLSKRAYLGPTSLDPELSLVMANLAQVRPGDAVFDPFVGTGSLALAAAELGGLPWGTDIDYRVVVLGKQGRDVRSNFAQRGQPLPELVRGDNSIPTLRPARPFFEAIVTDPPYGVRAGARKSGNKLQREPPQQQQKPCTSATETAGEAPCDPPPSSSPDGGSGASSSSDPLLPPSATHSASPSSPHFPATVPYEGEEVMIDLLDTAARLLVPGGRLVYLYPCVPQEYSRGHLPSHPVLTLVADPEERLSQMLSRRIVVMVKTGVYAPERQGEYRAAAVAAAVAAGTLGAGRGLKDRLGRAYDAWYDAHKVGEGALRGELQKRKGAGSGGGGSHGEAADSAQQRLQQQQRLEGEDEVEADAVPGKTRSGATLPHPSSPTAPPSDQDQEQGQGQQLGQLSRKVMKLQLKKLHRQEQRRQRVAVYTAALAAGLPPPKKALTPGALANAAHRERVAAGLAPPQVGQAKFARAAPPAGPAAGAAASERL